MELPHPVFETIFENEGLICGGFVRDYIIRGEGFDLTRKINVLIPYCFVHSLLRDLKENFRFRTHNLNNFLLNSEENLEIQVDQFIFEISSSEDHSYQQPADVDVNTLCWIQKEVSYCVRQDGKEVSGIQFERNGVFQKFRKEDQIYSWKNFTTKDEVKYGVKLTISEICRRCLRKEAILLLEDWKKGDNHNFSAQLDELLLKGWALISK